MKFNSQICTTKEQSQRLLDLGLNPETADMSYYVLDSEPVLTIGMAQVYTEVIKGGKIVETRNAEIIPAWSLHRLIEIVNLKIQFRLKEKTTVIYGISHSQPFQSFSGFGIDGKSYYNSVINAIEWLIKEGYFNKEYLRYFQKSDKKFEI